MGEAAAKVVAQGTEELTLARPDMRWVSEASREKRSRRSDGR